MLHQESVEPVSLFHPQLAICGYGELRRHGTDVALAARSHTGLAPVWLSTCSRQEHLSWSNGSLRWSGASSFPPRFHPDF